MSRLNASKIGEPEILLVAATENFRNTVSRILARCGYRVRTVASGEQALEQLGKKSCDLLVSEAYLPGMSGLSLLYHMRHRGFGMAVILVAEGLTERLRWIASGMGQVHCLRFPIDLDHLKKLLATCLASAKRLAQAQPGQPESTTENS